jgi:general secretion pathway protein C
MKRLPLVLSFLALVVVSGSCAYWGMLLFKPPQRALAAVQMQAPPEPSVTAARGLFGGDVVVAAASNYQLRGVVAAGNGRGSVAIIAADGKPAKAYPVGAEVVSGVKVQEVQARFAVLSEGGVPKRIELMPDTREGGGTAAPMGSPQPPMQPGQSSPQPQPQPQPQMPAPQPVQQQPAPPAVPVITPSMQPGMPRPNPVTVSPQPPGGNPLQ